MARAVLAEGTQPGRSDRHDILGRNHHDVAAAGWELCLWRICVVVAEAEEVSRTTCEAEGRVPWKNMDGSKERLAARWPMATARMRRQIYSVQLANSVATLVFDGSSDWAQVRVSSSWTKTAVACSQTESGWPHSGPSSRLAPMRLGSAMLPTGTTGTAF
jgi:hypothetical protein